MERDGLSAAAAQARITAQWPLSRKRVLADHILCNQGPPDAWQPVAMDLLRNGGI